MPNNTDQVGLLLACIDMRSITVASMADEIRLNKQQVAHWIQECQMETVCYAE